MSTPEGKVKKDLKKYLTEKNAWQLWAVPNGMGRSGVLDCQVAYKSIFFSVECKAPGRREEENQGASALQVKEMKYIDRTGSTGFLFDGEEDDWWALRKVIERIDLGATIEGLGRKPY